MVNLNNEQSELLYTASEWHFKWFEIYSANNTTFGEVLKMNHEKISHVAEMFDYDPVRITAFLVTMCENYESMYNDYSL